MSSAVAISAQVAVGATAVAVTAQALVFTFGVLAVGTGVGYYAHNITSSPLGFQAGLAEYGAPSPFPSSPAKLDLLYVSDPIENPYLISKTPGKGMTEQGKGKEQESKDKGKLPFEKSVQPTDAEFSTLPPSLSPG